MEKTLKLHNILILIKSSYLFWLFVKRQSSNNEWQRVVISANFPFLRIREEPTTEYTKENPFNLEEDLLNYEQKQAPKKKY